VRLLEGMTRALLAIVIALAATAALPRAAHAQWTNSITGNTFNNPMSSSLDTMIQHSFDRERMLAKLKKTDGSAVTAADLDGTAAATVAHKPIKTSDFKRRGGRPAVDAFFAANELDAESAAALRQIVDATFTAVEANARKNNVATAIAIALVASVQVSTATEVPDENATALVADVNDLLAGSAAFKKMKAKDRQTVYDSLILTTALMLALDAAGANDPDAKAAAKQMAEEMLARLTSS
jgi:hypothetical protein